MRSFIAILGLPVFALLAGAAGKQPVTGSDILKIRNITSVAVASDGSFAVYGVQSIHSEPAADGKGEPAYKYRTHLWRIDLNSPAARPEQLTFGDRSDSVPGAQPRQSYPRICTHRFLGREAQAAGLAAAAARSRRSSGRHQIGAGRCRPSGAPMARRSW